MVDCFYWLGFVVRCFLGFVVLFWLFACLFVLKLLVWWVVYDVWLYLIYRLGLVFGHDFDFPWVAIWVWFWFFLICWFVGLFFVVLVDVHLWFIVLVCCLWLDLVVLLLGVLFWGLFGLLFWWVCCDFVVWVWLRDLLVIGINDLLLDLFLRVVTLFTFICFG